MLRGTLTSGSRPRLELEVGKGQVRGRRTTVDKLNEKSPVKITYLQGARRFKEKPLGLVEFLWSMIFVWRLESAGALGKGCRSGAEWRGTAPVP